jgi:hypothetical protein
VAPKVSLIAALLWGCPERPADSAYEAPREFDASSPPVPSAHAMGDAGPSNAASDAATDPGGYEWITKRPGVTVAIAEARGVERARLETVGAAIADAFSRCVRERAKPPSGALRLVIALQESGVVTGFNLTASEDARVLALVCFVAPAKAQNYGMVQKTDRTPGVAFEAVWNVATPEVTRSPRGAGPKHACEDSARD